MQSNKNSNMAGYSYSVGNGSGVSGHTSSNPQQPTMQESHANRMVLRCNQCSAMMDVVPNSNIISCPYCGAKELIVESDQVKIEEFRQRTYRDIETTRYTSEVELKKIELEKDRLEKEESAKVGKMIIILTIVGGSIPFLILLLSKILG